MRPLIYIASILLFLFVGSCKNNTQTSDNQVQIETDTIATSQKDSLPEIQYDIYCNQTYNYCVQYPSSFLIPQGEMTNGEGQIFAAPGNKAELKIYRDPRTIYLGPKFELEEAYNQDRAENNETQKGINSQHLEKTFYTLTGTIGNRSFQQKTILSHFILITVILVYDESEKNIYEPLVGQIFDSMQ